MPWQQPKTDWNSDDYFNVDDLNRIESNTLEVYLLAKVLRGAFDLEEIKINHDMKAIPFADLLNKIERNINAIGDKLYKPKNWNPLAAAWQANMPFSYQTLNMWESNLLLLYNYAKGNIDKIPYCGQIYAGEEVI